MSKSQSHPSIKILLYSPNKPVQSISAKLNGKIKSLQKLFPKDEKTFVYNGLELCENRTFSSYDMSDGDTIIVLSKSSKFYSASLSRWISITNDNDGFLRRMRGILDSKTRSEVVKIQDLSMFKCERKPKLFAKICKRFLTLDDQTTGINVSLNIDINPISEPSKDPLPIFWDVE